MTGVTVVETKEAIPDPGPDDVFVIIDVYRFSTTVVALLEEGATHVKAAKSLDVARAYGEEVEGAMVGGEPHDEDPAFEVMNSPSFVREVDVRGRPVCLFSENGARAVERVEGAAAVYVATSWNLGAVAEALADVDHEDVVLVATGANGEVRYEDTTVAYALQRRLEEGALEGAKLETYRLAVEGVNARHSTSGRDALDAELLPEFDRSTVVPRLRDGVLVADGG